MLLNRGNSECFARLALIVTFFICFAKVKFLSMMTPKYLIDGDHFIGVFLILIC